MVYLVGNYPHLHLIPPLSWFIHTPTHKNREGMKLISRFYINLHTYCVPRRAVRKVFTLYPIFLCLKGNVDFRKIWDSEHLKSRRPGLATGDEGLTSLCLTPPASALAILTKHAPWTGHVFFAPFLGADNSDWKAGWTFPSVYGNS